MPAIILIIVTAHRLLSIRVSTLDSGELNVSDGSATIISGEQCPLLPLTPHHFQKTPSYKYLEQRIACLVKNGHSTRLLFICRGPHKATLLPLTARMAGKSVIFLIVSPSGIEIHNHRGAP